MNASLKNVRDDLVALFADASGIALSKEYEGEFDPDGDWTPVMPCVLIEMQGKSPQTHNNSGETDRWKYDVLLRVAGKYGDEDSDPLTAVDYVMELLVDLYFAYDDVNITAFNMSSRLAAREKSVKMYEVSFELY